MKGFSANIEKDTLENNNFRKVLYSAKHCQLVLMSLKPGEEIGMEVHDENDQFFRFEQGEGKVFIDENEYPCQRRQCHHCAIRCSAQRRQHVTNRRSKTLHNLFTPSS